MIASAVVEGIGKPQVRGLVVCVRKHFFRRCEGNTAQNSRQVSKTGAKNCKTIQNSGEVRRTANAKGPEAEKGVVGYGGHPPKTLGVGLVGRAGWLRSGQVG